MKYIIKINDKTSRYLYSVWEVYEYEDGSVSEQARIFCGDDLEEFHQFLKTLK